MAILSAPQELTFTNDQDNALKSIKDFLSSERSIFLLKGYAGTGKTTLVKELCRYIAAKGNDFSLLAPTGRAAMVLRSKTDQDANTSHRSIYNLNKLKEKREGTSFKFYFDLNLNDDSTQCVYLVDEASLVSDVYTDDEFFRFGSGFLLQDLIQYAQIGGSNRKIIFVGDHAQLPPVNMPFSPALSLTYIEQETRVTTQETTLREVVRQKSDSTALQAATKVRHSIEKGDYSNFRLPFSGSDTSRINPDSFDQTFSKAAKEYGLENCIVITHANRQALAYNRRIRSLRYGDADLKLQKRDRLLITKNNYNSPVELFNGMFADVTEVGNIVYQAKPRFTVEGGKTVERHLTFREVTVQVTDVNHNKHPLRTTLLDGFLWEEEGRLHPYDQRALYIDFKNRMLEKGIKENSEDFKERLKSDQYFNTLQAKFGYAITCHKSQGGEWPFVMVDFNVFIGKMTEPFFRWSYTAITRTDQSLVCIDPPDFNAFNQFVVKPIDHIAKVLKGAYYIPSSDSNPFYFVTYRKERLYSICEYQGISVTFQDHNYQLAATFKKGESTAKAQLWYNKNGFSKISWENYNDEDFKSLIAEILLDSIIPDEVPFEPKFEFQRGLHQYILELLKEEDIPLTNIVQDHWKDQYFIYTGADCAAIEFFFNKQYIYTKAQPLSTLGDEDEKLKRLVSKLKGEIG